MDTVRDVCSAGSALRKAANLRNRLPLAQLRKGHAAWLPEYMSGKRNS